MNGIPGFRNKEIEQLYCNGLDIDKEIVEQILSLPRISLLKDLELVLFNSIDQYPYLSKKGTDEKNTIFLVHAFFLLGELEASEIIDSMLLILEQEEDFLEFYFGDILTEFVWEIFYKVGRYEFDLLEEFMCQPDIYEFSKTEIGEVIEQVALHDPDRRDEAIRWFRDVFRTYIDSNINEGIFEGSVIGSMVCGCLNIGAVELLPEIERLYELGYVPLDYCGDLNQVKNDFEKEEKYSEPRKMMGMLDRYNEVLIKWHNWEEDLASQEMDFKSLTNKIGRNDSCSCGSGKKYKKCCL